MLSMHMTIGKTHSLFSRSVDLNCIVTMRVSVSPLLLLLFGISVYAQTGLDNQLKDQDFSCPAAAPFILGDNLDARSWPWNTYSPPLSTYDYSILSTDFIMKADRTPNTAVLYVSSMKQVSMNQTVDVAPATWYKLSAWVRTSDVSIGKYATFGSGGAYIGFQTTPSASFQTCNRSASLTGNTDWTYISLDVYTHGATAVCAHSEPSMLLFCLNLFLECASHDCAYTFPLQLTISIGLGQFCGAAAAFGAAQFTDVSFVKYPDNELPILSPDCT